ncbi:uncharacterized protein LOC123403719 [Hordeum vulgare subsp. vulgare]|uniref:Uncharacterized protein n=2 Tax=Hordeum vulgare subsp. vulgare TaxID=112509 RepID=A0A8I6WAG4_HORVV|nr:uncharacterized protein LOC123403697 [Hordeum vulgare subsp. vulgare]XP_044953571.1 uncharacterized protein LOC123403719 [Hordeum vulgare subsp. vulgare]
MSMEPSWVVTCDPGWSMEEEAAAWRSDDRISFQTSLPSQSDSIQLQVVEYAAPDTAAHDICSETVQVFEEVTQVFNDNYLVIMKDKMHKFPPSLGDVPDWWKVSATVAIGPYYHGTPGLLEAEQVKHSAANQCIRDSPVASLQEMYNAVFDVLPDALNLYYQDELAKFCHDDLLPMMFIDACFLVQFMRWYGLPDGAMHEALESYFSANYERICTDIMMLQNQIPWLVVKTIFRFMPPAPSSSCCHWERFVIAMRRGLGNQVDPGGNIDVDPEYNPPHVLGLIWHYTVQNNNHHDDDDDKDDDDKDDNNNNDQENKQKPLSISVAKLAAIGITLVSTRNEWNAGLMSMRLKRTSWCIFVLGDLEVQPLYLSDGNAAWLVNMAAFELCKTQDFQSDHVHDRDSAVCSYLHLFAMLLDQKQDVHELQKEHVIKGGGLTSKMTLEFFASIGKSMRPGTFYLHKIKRIEKFRNERSRLLTFILFLKRKRAKVMALISIIAAVVGILSSLQALKPH